MTYRKSDGPFGLLRKKTAMDLEWANSRPATAPWGRETDPPGHRPSETEHPVPQGESEALPWKKTHRM